MVTGWFWVMLPAGQTVCYTALWFKMAIWHFSATSSADNPKLSPLAPVSFSCCSKFCPRNHRSSHQSWQTVQEVQALTPFQKLSIKSTLLPQERKLSVHLLFLEKNDKVENCSRAIMTSFLKRRGFVLPEITAALLQKYFLLSKGQINTTKYGLKK